MVDLVEAMKMKICTLSPTKETIASKQLATNYLNILTTRLPDRRFVLLKKKIYQILPNFLSGNFIKPYSDYSMHDIRH